MRVCVYYGNRDFGSLNSYKKLKPLHARTQEPKPKKITNQKKKRKGNDASVVVVVIFVCVGGTRGRWRNLLL